MVTDICAVMLMAFGFTAQSTQARAHLHSDFRSDFRLSADIGRRRSASQDGLVCASPCLAVKGCALRD
jgi:hypothetical protein